MSKCRQRDTDQVENMTPIRFSLTSIVLNSWVHFSVHVVPKLAFKLTDNVRHALLIQESYELCITKSHDPITGLLVMSSSRVFGT